MAYDVELEQVVVGGGGTGSVRVLSAEEKESASGDANGSGREKRGSAAKADQKVACVPVASAGGLRQSVAGPNVAGLIAGMEARNRAAHKALHDKVNGALCTVAQRAILDDLSRQVDVALEAIKKAGGTADDVAETENLVEIHDDGAGGSR